MDTKIEYSYLEIDEIACFSEKIASEWIEKLISSHQKKLVHINYIFSSDKNVFELNSKYLGHRYNTDILSFDLSESEEEIEGDIYISIDRVQANAFRFKNSFLQELYRVMAHGLLHFVGYDDGTDMQKKEMTEQEDHALSLLCL